MFTKFDCRQLVVDHGRVCCPQRDDCDIGCCFGCPSLMKMRLGEPIPTITCGTRLSLAVPAISLF